MRALVLSLSLLLSAGAFEYGLKPDRLNDAVYCFFGAPEAMDTRNNGNMVNSCYVDLLDAWLVVDSGPTHAYAREAFALMQRIKPMPVRFVIDTHVHDDHWLGNDFYQSVGATVVGSSEFARKINPEAKTRMQSRITEAAYDKTVPALPDQSIAQRHVLQTSRGEVIMQIHPRRAHTDADLYVHLPAIRTVFAGDLVFNDRLPSLREGDVNGWLDALERIDALGARTVVGGHGRESGPEATAFTKAYLSALKSGVLDAIEEGLSIDESVAALPMEGYRNAAMYEVLHAANVNAAYRTLEWGDE